MNIPTGELLEIQTKTHLHFFYLTNNKMSPIFPFFHLTNFKHYRYLELYVYSEVLSNLNYLVNEQDEINEQDG